MKKNRKNQNLSKEERAIKRANDIKNCGQPIHILNKKNGEYQWMPQYCKYYRECPNCLEKRRRVLYSMLSTAMNYESDGQLYGVLLDTDQEANRLSRKLDKSRYKRIPLENDETLFITNDYEAVYEYDGQFITREMISDYKRIKRWATTPPGKRITGSLGNKSKELELEFCEKTTAKNYKFNGKVDKEVIHGYSKAALALARDITYQTLQKAINSLQYLFEQELINNGVEFECETSNTSRTDLREVQWCQIKSISKSNSIIEIESKGSIPKPHSNYQKPTRFIGISY